MNKCPVCAKAKSHLPPKSKLGETLIATRPGQIYSLDLVTGLNPTKNQNQYLLTIQDHFSRYIWLFALHTQTSYEIAEKLLVAISQGGVPDIIITNLAPNLIGSLMTKLYSLLGIKKHQTMAFTPKALGVHERFHRTMSA